MKKDNELIRKILLELENKENPGGWIIPEFDNYSEEQVAYHIKILADTGYIDAIDLSTMDGIEWGAKDLTWQGHEFLDASRNNTIWNKAKREVGDKFSSISLEVLKEILIKMMIN